MRDHILHLRVERNGLKHNGVDHIYPQSRIIISAKSPGLTARDQIPSIFVFIQARPPIHYKVDRPVKVSDCLVALCGELGNFGFGRDDHERYKLVVRSLPDVLRWERRRFGRGQDRSGSSPELAIGRVDRCGLCAVQRGEEQGIVTSGPPHLESAPICRKLTRGTHDPFFPRVR